MGDRLPAHLCTWEDLRAIAAGGGTVEADYLLRVIRLAEGGMAVVEAERRSAKLRDEVSQLREQIRQLREERTKARGKP